MNVNGVKPVARVTPLELTVVHTPLNCLPVRSTDIAVIVAVGIAGVDVVVEFVVLVAELGLVVVEVDAVVVVVVEEVVEVDRVKATFVFPCKVNVEVPPPPFALVLAKVPRFAPTTKLPP